MRIEQERRKLLRSGFGIVFSAGCMLLVAGCALGSAKFGDPEIPPPAPPPSGSA